MNFFKTKNNQNKNYIYLLVSKISDNIIQCKVLISKSLLLHEYSYLINNFDMFTPIKEPEKIIETFVLDYKFENLYSVYPYNLFYINRVLLYSFLYVCEKCEILNKNFENSQNIKESDNKVYFVSNINYLKRVKEWSTNWKKNMFSIEKYHNYDTDNENLFSINNISNLYFKATENKDESKENEYKNNDIDNHINNNQKYIKFNCNLIPEEDKSLFERISERPNSDLLNKCIPYFEEQKVIKFL
jgi:hypothetical protein